MNMSHSKKEEEIEKVVCLEDQKSEMFGLLSAMKYKLNSIEEELRKSEPNLPIIKKYMELFRKDAKKTVDRAEYTLKEVLGENEDGQPR
jgi:PHD/YefM family antitoxin component YafN of YafNO toxin-antitoxin module